ncbi:MAG: membrane-bound lytic murein transglycosylase MltF [Acidobacteriota bacterium]|nr:membrane-bound lytic murein transglycosylase MltF [Acidobacteriota bacterium]
MNEDNGVSLKGPRSPMSKKLLFRLTLCVLFIMAACGRQEHAPDALADLQRSGELIILTRNAPTTYYQGREEWEGFEYELASAFARSLNLKPKFRVLDNTAELLTAINRGEGHIAAAGLTRTQEREARFLFGPDYLTVTQKVICRRGKPMPKHLDDLSQLSLSVVADSSYEERLRELRTENPELTWTGTREFEAETLMDEVWQGQLDCTVADSLIVDINQRYYPELSVAFDLTESEPLGWVVAPAYAALIPKMNDWIERPETQKLIEDFKEKYFGFVPIFDYVDLKTFQRRIRDRLPGFQADFKDAAARYGLDWQLLAAQAYQESHWDVQATSPTGVRGIMMLTKRTASQLGIFDRLDPRASIMGGTRYLVQIYDRLPETIQEPDRTWIALAAYNVGFGHVTDARLLAKEKGLNPDLWRDLREVLPLLTQRKYYKRLPHGYARGREPVRYVQRIRNFHDLLERHMESRPELVSE